MKKSNLSEMVRGWFIGNFEPSILKTNFFEVGVVTHRKGEFWPPHYHKSSTEINLLLSGEMIVNDTRINENDFFLLEKEEVGKVSFLEDCKVLVIRVPEIANDKVIV